MTSRRNAPERPVYLEEVPMHSQVRPIRSYFASAHSAAQPARIAHSAGATNTRTSLIHTLSILSFVAATVLLCVSVLRTDAPRSALLIFAFVLCAASSVLTLWTDD